LPVLTTFFLIKNDTFLIVIPERRCRESVVVVAIVVAVVVKGLRSGPWPLSLKVALTGRQKAF